MDSEKKVFIVSTESRSGKSLFTLGLMKALGGHRAQGGVHEAHRAAERRGHRPRLAAGPRGLRPERGAGRPEPGHHGRRPGGQGPAVREDLRLLPAPGRRTRTSWSSKAPTTPAPSPPWSSTSTPSWPITWRRRCWWWPAGTARPARRSWRIWPRSRNPCSRPTAVLLGAVVNRYPFADSGRWGGGPEAGPGGPGHRPVRGDAPGPAAGRPAPARGGPQARRQDRVPGRRVEQGGPGREGAGHDAGARSGLHQGPARLPAGHPGGPGGQHPGGHGGPALAQLPAVLRAGAHRRTGARGRTSAACSRAVPTAG